MATHSTEMIREKPEKLIDLDKVWSIVKKNWLVLKSDRTRLIAMFAFPLIMILIYGSTTGVSTKGINAAVVDYDHSGYSSQVLSALYSDQTFTVIQVIGSQDQAKRMLESGQVKAVFVVPAGFGRSIDNGSPEPLTVMVDESDPSTQVTKPTAEGLAARLSAQFSQERLQAVDSNLQAASVQLAQANSAIVSANSKDLQPQESQTAQSFAQANLISAIAQKSLLASALAQGNTISNPINPNNFLISSQNQQYSSGLGQVLSIIYAQQTAIALENFDRAQAGEIAVITGDTASIYSNYLSLVAYKQQITSQLKIAVNTIALAQSEVSGAGSQSSIIIGSIPVTFNNPFGSGRNQLDFLLANILALVIFQGAAAGLGRAIAGERQNGSLTRVFLTPTSSTTIITGTQVFYLMLEAARSTLLLLIAIVFFGVGVTGSIFDFLFIILLYAIGATGVGMVLSVVAKNQEQYQALSLLVIVPTIFLSGVFFPIQTLPGFLQSFANVLPMAYAADAMSAILVKGFGITQVLPDILFLVGFGALTVAASIVMFKRELV